MDTHAGPESELHATGHLLTKVGGRPVVVFWHENQAWAIDDRCPHLGLPLHQGTVESGMVTCHWHHARFDLSSGCTLDPWADDAAAYDVAIRDGEVYVATRPPGDVVGQLFARLRNGLEDRITLVIAKSVLGLIDEGVDVADIVAAAADFGATTRGAGWGAGMTVLTAMASVTPRLHPDDRALALTQALAFLAADVAGHPPRFALEPMAGADLSAERLESWFRRFVDTRSGDAAERTLASALVADHVGRADVEAMMFAAVTDHVFIDEGHTVDFTNKAFELVDLLGTDRAIVVLPTLVHEMASATRHEELSAWRHPHDLAGPALGTELTVGAGIAESDVAALGRALLVDDPAAIVDQLVAAGEAGATAEQMARAVALAAALRIVRFHTTNDHRDWDTVHHAMTTANAVHAAVARHDTPELRRAIVHGALKVYLDRFLNVPAARLPEATTGSLASLAACWEVQGAVAEAGREANGFLVDGGDPEALIAALGRALLAEDATFHWFQLYEAVVAQHDAWPAGSPEGRIPLVAFARFLAAHTPTRRETSRVVDIARRLRRGDPLHEADDAASDDLAGAGADRDSIAAGEVPVSVAGG
ncbi:MAG: Rieske (2Fe-2S) protein [Actinomycetota bacterium]